MFKGPHSYLTNLFILPSALASYKKLVTHKNLFSILFMIYFYLNIMHIIFDIKGTRNCGQTNSRLHLYRYDFLRNVWLDEDLSLLSF